MAELKIVASIEVKKEYQAEIEKVFANLVPETRKEAGNISYELHVDTKNPLKYTFIEVWKSEEAIAIHNNTPHFAAFKDAIDGKINDLKIDIIKKIL